MCPPVRHLLWHISHASIKVRVFNIFMCKEGKDFWNVIYCLNYHKQKRVDQLNYADHVIRNGTGYSGLRWKTMRNE